MKRFPLLFLMLPLWAFGQPDPASPPTPPERALRAVATLPVLHDGRVKPLDTFARQMVAQFSGRHEVEGVPALEWTTRLLFAPETTRANRVFLVNNPHVLEAMGLEPFEEIPGSRKPSTRRFSFEHLQPGLDELDRLARRAGALEPENRSVVDNELLRLYNNVAQYLLLGRSFAHTRANPMFQIEDDDLLDKLGLRGTPQPFSYMDLRPFLEEAAGRFSGSVSATDLARNFSESEQRLFFFLMEFSQRTRGGPLMLLPLPPHGPMEWVPPFDALYADGRSDARDVELLNAARRSAELATAWNQGDWNEAIAAADDIKEFTRTRMSGVRDVRLTLSEARYNRANLFGKARFFYFLAFLPALAAVISGKRLFRGISLALVFAGLIWHVVGIGWRVYLTARPPVTNLYGTFLFVGLLCLLLALLVEAFQKNGMGLFGGSFTALSLLMLAERFAVEGDTLQKMQAVLASNFWLSTHVLAVTTGYAGVWIAGVFGHIWLVMKLLRRPESSLRPVMNALMGLLGFGLTFAFLGTMLGGVWADQSWGRFWGWDPKENGAILIVLWTAVIYHARVGGMIRDLGTAALSALGCVVVMLAWIGVNLLGVGLHSYGFTNAMRNGFYGYIGAELFFVGLAVGAVLIFNKADTADASAPPQPDTGTSPTGLGLLAGVLMFWGGLGLFSFLVMQFGYAAPDLTTQLQRLGLSQFKVGGTALVLYALALAGGIGLVKRQLWGWVCATLLSVFLFTLKLIALVKIELRLAGMSRDAFEQMYGPAKTQTFLHILPVVFAVMMFAFLIRKSVREWNAVDKKSLPTLLTLILGGGASLGLVFAMLAMVSN